MSDYLVDGMYGLIIGDALGVPVEFTRRAERKEDPVTSMSGYGTHKEWAAALQNEALLKEIIHKGYDGD